ncbi:MAG: AI-2E family transporter [bacterium]|nr:AI-2E family transporter [bacterium]
MNALSPPATSRLLLSLSLGGLLLLAFLVLQPFLAPVAWAGILVYVTWPLYLRLRARMGGRATLASLIMTLLLAVVLILPLVWVLLMMRTEVADAYQRISGLMSEGHIALPPEVRRLPLIGHELGAFFDRLNADPVSFKNQLASWSDYAMNHAGDLMGGVSRNLAKLGMALFTAFFFYRDGEAFVLQIRKILTRRLGPRIDGYIDAMGATARAVVYGIILTALAQGLLAGVGYAVAGVDSPMFMTAATTLAAMIPFGTPFVWGAICIWLFVQGHTLAAIGLTAWCMVVVSWVDNIIRPLVISSATKIPFLLVMFGVLGGLAAFGMVGLFMGPVILAVVVAVWREWLEDAEEDAHEPPAA